MAEWTIAGVGAIGGLWAHKLHNAGHSIKLILKDPQQLEQYTQAGGISVLQGSGVTTRHNFMAQLAGDINRPIGNLLVCCKSWQTEAVLAALKPVLNNTSNVVLLQNGLRQLYASQALLECCAFYCASTTDGAFLVKPYTVKLAGSGQTSIGAFNASAKRQTIALADAQWQDDIEILLWRKLCVNAVINPLTARYDLPNGDILTDARCTKIIPALCAEISAIVSASGHMIGVDELMQYVNEVASATAANSSSMREDVRAKRTTEIGEINAYLIALAKTQGLAHTINRDLVSVLETLRP